MTAHDLTDLERGVLEKLLEGQHPLLEALRVQLTGCRASSRAMTGYGFFTELQIDRTSPAARTSAEKVRIGDVNASIAGLNHGAGFVLFVKAGYLDMLEGYTFDEPWPESAVDFELSYTGEPRDMCSLQPDP